MSQLQDDCEEPQIQEKFVQTYLIISGLLLSKMQTTAEINNTISLNQSDMSFTIGDLGFTIFIVFILIYYMIPSLAFIKTNIIINFIDLLIFISAIIASFGLALQITSAIMSSAIMFEKYMIILIIPIAGLLSCTLTPRITHKYIILEVLKIIVFSTAMIIVTEIALYIIPYLLPSSVKEWFTTTLFESTTSFFSHLIIYIFAIITLVHMIRDIIQLFKYTKK